MFELFSDPASDRFGNDRLTLAFKPIASDYCRIDPNRNTMNQVSKSNLSTKIHKLPIHDPISYMPIVSY